MEYFAKPALAREQMVLIATTVDERIPEDHPVRLFWEVLSSQDFSSWEERYNQRRGQPPIPPRIVAATILYGMSRGIRASRRLEYECENAVDFMWLTEGRHIDHSTFCKFRTRFNKELKALFRDMGKLAMAMGLVRLNEVALDGTRVRANSSRSSTATARTLEGRLAALDGQIATMFSEADEADRRDGLLFDAQDSPTSLPRKLGTLKKRQEALRKALQAARRADAKRGLASSGSKETGVSKDKGVGEASVAKGEGGSKIESGSKRPAKVPVADPESAILPKQGRGIRPELQPDGGGRRSLWDDR